MPQVNKRRLAWALLGVTVALLAAGPPRLRSVSACAVSFPVQGNPD